MRIYRLTPTTNGQGGTHGWAMLAKSIVVRWYALASSRLSVTVITTPRNTCITRNLKEAAMCETTDYRALLSPATSNTTELYSYDATLRTAQQKTARHTELIYSSGTCMPWLDIAYSAGNEQRKYEVQYCTSTVAQMTPFGSCCSR